jgi:hypothetical protein
MRVRHFVMVLLPTACSCLLAQPAPTVAESIPFPDHSGMVASFTERWLPLSEPPRAVEMLGIVIRDADGKLIASTEVALAYGFLAHGMVLVDASPKILLGAWMADGPGNKLFVFRFDGLALIRQAEWTGADFDYSETASGDLKVVISQSYAKERRHLDGARTRHAADYSVERRR